MPKWAISACSPVGADLGFNMFRSLPGRCVFSKLWVWKAGDGFWQKSSPLVTTLITRESERCRVRAVFYDCRTRETGGLVPIRLAHSHMLAAKGFQRVPDTANGARRYLRAV